MRSLPSRLGAVYDLALVQARATARQHGYALAVHGSQLRDFDIIAVPWVEEASAPQVLAEAICAAVGGVFTTKDVPPNKPTKRPHGRLSWAITLMRPSARVLVNATSSTKTPFHPYLDLSIMPPRRRRATTADA